MFFLVNNGFPLFNSWKMKKNMKIIQVDLQHKPQPRDLNNFEGIFLIRKAKTFVFLSLVCSKNILKLKIDLN